ncbi:MAG: hypothetical protein WBV77_10675 [Solirubrobacteraceae bacterium]
MRRNLLLSLVSALVLGAMGTAAPAFANWTPNETKVTFASSNVAFEIENEGKTITTLGCAGTSAFGETGKNTASFTFMPEFANCTFTATATAGWKAIAVTATEANIEIPIKGATITDGACKIELAPTKAETIKGTYKAGKPSTWTFAPTSIGIAENAINCFNKITAQTKATIKATIIVIGAGGAMIEP